jgi:hypothetical protein
MIAVAREARGKADEREELHGRYCADWRLEGKKPGINLDTSKPAIAQTLCIRIPSLFPPPAATRTRSHLATGEVRPAVDCVGPWHAKKEVGGVVAGRLDVIRVGSALLAWRRRLVAAAGADQNQESRAQRSR